MSSATMKTSMRHNREEHLRRLEEAQRRTNERLEQQRARIDARFERIRSRLGPEMQGETSDSQQRIIDTALGLLKEDGLSELTLRKLAQKLHMQAPALYWHFKSKEVLIDYMAEAILHKEFNDLQPRKDPEPWQDWFIAVLVRLRRAMLVYPDGGRVVAGAHMYPAVSLARFFEISLQSLRSAGLSEKDAELITSTAVHFVFGRVIEEQSSPSLEEVRALDFEAMAQDFPNFVNIAKRAAQEYESGNFIDDFEDCLRLIIH